MIMRSVASMVALLFRTLTRIAFHRQRQSRVVAIKRLSRSMAVCLIVANLAVTTNGAHGAEPFVVYNALTFEGQPDLSVHGLQAIEIAGTVELWPSAADRNEPDLAYLREVYIPQKLERSEASIHVINIEHWATESRYARGTASEILTSISKLSSVLEAFREYAPKMQHGIYAILPVREYSAPTSGNRESLDLWRKDNDRLTPLSEAVDIVFPSLYTFYDDPEAWRIYAITNILVARQYGKPVVPFLWPQFHGSGDKAFQLISARFWKVQLETVYSYADGVVIWGPPARRDPGWDPTAGWWVETLNFLARHQLNR